MRRLRLLGLALVAILAPGVIACASALAVEPGILFLAGEVAPVTYTASGGPIVYRPAGGGEIICQKEEEKGSLGTAGATHAILGTATIDYKECKQVKEKTEISCRSENTKGEKDPAGVFLATYDVHLIDVLTATGVLEPGIAYILLEVEKLVCGLAIIEVKGVFKGLVLVASLVNDGTVATLDFVAAGEKCDSSDKLCEELNMLPAQIKVGKEFENVSLEGTLSVTFAKMVLFDD